MKKLKGSVRQQTLARLKAEDAARAAMTRVVERKLKPTDRYEYARIELKVTFVIDTGTPLTAWQIKKIAGILNSEPGYSALEGLCHSLTEATGDHTPDDVQIYPEETRWDVLP